MFPLTLALLAAAACGEKGPGTAVEPDETTACKEVGNRVTVTGFFLGGDGVVCQTGDCIGSLVSDAPSTSQGLPIKRLPATAAIGDGKNQIKPAIGGLTWKFSSSHDSDGKLIDDHTAAKYSGKLKKMDSGCTLEVDRIDPLVPTGASSAK